jgi:hypothetical protein
MKRVVLIAVLIAVGPAYLFPQKSDQTEINAIITLRKLAMAESHYAMGHPEEGFACDPQVLTKIEWPNSSTHATLADPAWLSGTGQYRYSVKCADRSKPFEKLQVFAEPVDATSGLPTYCASGSFHALPVKGTSEFTVKKNVSGNGEGCIASGKPLG